MSIAVISVTDVKKIGFFLGPLLFAMVHFIPVPTGMTTETWHTAGLAFWMIVWWVSEAAPLPITALLPVIIFPIFDILDLKNTLIPYANPVIFLFLGGFIIAMAIQKSNLHVRIALNIVNIIGTRPDRMVAGFMVAGAFLSMWISNTATMLMMLPICLSVVSLLADDFGKESPKAAKNFAICMLLGIAFATSVGGVGTLIGTPPNAFFKGYMSNNYGIEIDFFRWMLIGIPVVIIMVSVLWLTMVKWIFRVDIDNNEKIDAVIQKELSQLGPMTKDEKVVTAIFAFTALFWMMRGILKPWLPDGLNDIIIAIIGALALFVIPVDFKKFRFVITWKDAEKLPWGVLILFGGGLSLASGFQASGLAEWIGMQFAGFADYPTPLLILMITFIALVFTSMMSNVATTTVMLPILVPFAIAIGEHPFLFAIPATIVASCAFMLPVSTANNAIAFSTGHVHIGDMIKAGVFASMFSLVLLLLLAMALIPAIFDISMGTVPDWAIER